MPPSTGTIGVGLVGFGTAGRFFHAPVIQAVPGLRLAAIVQRTGDSARRACPGAAILRSVDDLLALDEISLVVIATPNTSHGAIAIQCLEAGRHVVVDKPLAPSSAEAAAVVATAARAGLVLSVFHNRRWDGDFLTVRRLLDGRACGRPVLFESRFDRYRPQPKPGAWRERDQPGSGVLFDLGSHLVDQALELFGMPEAVTADVRTERDGVAADDAFDVTLHYPRMRARLGATMLAAAPGPRFVLRGASGSFVKHGVDPQEDALRAGDTPGCAGWGEEPENRWGILTRASAEGTAAERVRTLPGDYRVYYGNVRDAIRGTARLAVTPGQATSVIRLLELAIESSREGRTLSLVQ
jgi:scyllo-inositol 2-dehydrogenase (NADP+)